ncbi:MAG: acyltransferase [Hyphomicrobiales bacterium]|nr:MAG: acyltransferase [Hyphomicrobiales bacterium]
MVDYTARDLLGRSLHFSQRLLESVAANATPGVGVRHKFTGLDVLRGVAALAVLLVHSNRLLDAEWLVPSGWLAVDLFFAMSGFVIAHSYDHKLESLGGMGFFRVRFIRLWPLFMLGVALGALLALILLVRGGQNFGLSDVAVAIFCAALFIPAPMSALSQGALSPLNTPGWSLILEIWINCAFGFLHRRWSERVICAVAGFSALGIILFGVGGGHDIVHYFFRICFSFPLGVLIYRRREQLPRLGVLKPVLLPAVALSFFVEPSLAYQKTFVLLLSPAFLVIGSQCEFDRRVAEYCAMASYCVYAIHAPVLMLVGGFARSLGFSVVGITIFTIGALLVLPPYIDALYDRPMRLWLSQLKIRLPGMLRL